MEGLEGTAIRLAVRDPSCPQAPVLARSRRNPVLFRGGSCGWLRTRPEIVLPDTAFTDPPPARRLQIAYTWGGGGTRISSRGFPPWSTERVPGTSRASQILSILIRASRAQIATDVSPAGRPAAYLANSVIREQTAGRHVGDSKPHDLDAGVLRCLSSPVVTCHMPIRSTATSTCTIRRSTRLCARSGARAGDARAAAAAGRPRGPGPAGDLVRADQRAVVRPAVPRQHRQGPRRAPCLPVELPGRMRAHRDGARRSLRRPPGALAQAPRRGRDTGRLPAGGSGTRAGRGDRGTAVPDLPGPPGLPPDAAALPLSRAPLV